MIVLLITGRNKVLAKVMFLHMCVILFMGGLPDQAPPQDQAHTPGTRQELPGTRQYPWTREVPPRTSHCTPPDQTHPWDQTHTPGTRHPLEPDTPLPPRTADSGIRSTFGQYASYWNAFLFQLVNPLCVGTGP